MLTNEEVTGISRYIPTTLSKATLGSLIPSAIGAFVLVRGNPEWFLMQNQSREFQLLAGISASLGTALVLAIVALIDLSLVIHSKQHKIIYHYVKKKP